MKRQALAFALAIVAGCASAPASRSDARPAAPRPAVAGAPGARGLRLVYAVDLAHASEPGRTHDDLFGRAAEVVRKRVDGLFKDASVRRVDDDIEVLLTGTEEQFATFRRIARTPGRFRVAVVDGNSPFMLALARLRPDELPPGVTVRPDVWTHPSGGAQYEDVYLAAHDAHALAEAVAQLVGRYPLPADREILIDGGPREFRTYYVIKSGGLDNAAIESAEIRPGWDGRPELQLVLTPEGRRQFGDLTARAVGRKIAIAVDGMVGTAPVVLERIGGGRLHMMGNTDPDVDPAAVRRDLEDLAAVLRYGPLPAPLLLRVEDPSHGGPIRSTLR